jgi:hypothetical protein
MMMMLTMLGSVVPTGPTLKTHGRCRGGMHACHASSSSSRKGGGGSSSSSAPGGASERGERRRAARARRRADDAKGAKPELKKTPPAVNPRAKVVRRRGTKSIGELTEEPPGAEESVRAHVERKSGRTRDPKKAAEEREKLWARLGATKREDGGGSASYSHLLDPVSGKRGGDGDGVTSTRSRGSTRAALRLGYAAHRERFAKALKCELEEEMALSEQRLNTWSREKLVEEGYAILGFSREVDDSV